jgi:hypothetical protein
MFLALFLASLPTLVDTCAWSLSAVPSADISFSPALPGHPWNLGRAETYSSDWSARRIDPEVARQWDTLPSLATLELGASIDSFQVRSVLSLRRDMEAWAEDPAGSDILHGPDELDINVPYEGWLRWGSAHLGSFQIGRFRKSFSESPHGVILGGNIVHDAAWWRLPMGRWTFEWFASSLNPWLPGTHADGTVDTGSEAWRQVHSRVLNQRGRVYDEAYKTLFLHRLSCRLGDWDLAVVEQLLVGGKAPTLRDALPIQIWHDNYGDAYSKISTALDIAWNPREEARFHAQCLVEDIRSPVGEVDGADPRVIFGANAGWQGGWTTSVGTWSGSFDATATSPTLNNNSLPLLKGISRRLYRSNNEEQSSSDFADTWIVDQPLAYHRGPDAFDFWSSWGWTRPSDDLGANLELDFLQQGDATLWEDADSLERRYWPLSGVVERELRVRASGWQSFGRWSFRLGAGVSRLWNANHVVGKDRLVGTLSGGVGWRL